MKSGFLLRGPRSCFGGSCFMAGTARPRHGHTLLRWVMGFLKIHTWSLGSLICAVALCPRCSIIEVGVVIMLQVILILRGRIAADPRWPCGWVHAKSVLHRNATLGKRACGAFRRRGDAFLDSFAVPRPGATEALEDRAAVLLWGAGVSWRGTGPARVVIIACRRETQHAAGEVKLSVAIGRRAFGHGV